VIGFVPLFANWFELETVFVTALLLKNISAALETVDLQPIRLLALELT
jgi:hypothetical protein